MTAKDVTSDFKAEPLWTGNEKAVRTEHPGRGVRILRDSFDVPHVFGKTEADVFYGTGYAAAEDRGVLMELARVPGPARVHRRAGFNAFDVALSGKQFKPSAADRGAARAAAEAARRQDGAARSCADIDAYVAGINAQRKGSNLDIAPWTRNDVVAMTCLLGARFGAGGGDEARAASLWQRARAPQDLRRRLAELNDPSAPTTLATALPVRAAGRDGARAGNAIVADGSFAAPVAAAVDVERDPDLGEALRDRPPVHGRRPAARLLLSRVLLGGRHGGRRRVGARRPLAGIPNVLIGRGPDYGWSFTSSESDNIDTFAETLCGDDHHYLYKGACTAMTQVNAGERRRRAASRAR